MSKAAGHITSSDLYLNLPDINQYPAIEPYETHSHPSTISEEQLADLKLMQSSEENNLALTIQKLKKGLKLPQIKEESLDQKVRVEQFLMRLSRR